MPSSSRFHIRPGEIPGFHPANHARTLNRRLVGPQNVGATRMELILGTIERGGGALPHAHPGIEQACYLLSGAATVEIGDDSFTMTAGEACFFPADVPHVLSVTSAEPARLLVFYSPPYGEDPAKAVPRRSA